MADRWVEPCPFQTDRGKWIAKARVFRRMNDLIVETDIPEAETEFSTESEANAWSMAMGQRALDLLS